MAFGHFVTIIFPNFGYFPPNSFSPEHRFSSDSVRIVPDLIVDLYLSVLYNEPDAKSLKI